MPDWLPLALGSAMLLGFRRPISRAVAWGRKPENADSLLNVERQERIERWEREGGQESRALVTVTAAGILLGLAALALAAGIID